MPVHTEYYELLQQRRRAEAVEARRDTRRDLLRTALECVFWCGLGILLLLWSFHTDDDTLGHAAFWAGLGVGNGGWLRAVLAAYRRGEQRGDW